MTRPAKAIAKAPAGTTATVKDGPVTLALDVGGTGLKAGRLDPEGALIGDHPRIDTPHPCPPAVLLDALCGLAMKLGAFDRVSVGFPGVIRHGHVLTAPHLGNEFWRDVPFAEALAQRLARPVRILNDAEVQGLGIIRGHGLELVVTLGTGVGTAIFRDGAVMPHLELAHHPIHGKKTYDEYLGNDARREHRRKVWNKRVGRMIQILDTLINYDTLYLGGGNAEHVTLDLPANVHLASNDAGLTGGFKLWAEPSPMPPVT